jgi:exodeoxyribonuclease VII small subunit
MTYDSAIQELQEIVDALQDQRISIDDMEEKIARATELIRFCRTKLRTTETAVDRMLKEEE